MPCAQDFSALDAGAGHNSVCRKMRVPGGDAESVIQNHDAAITGVLPNVEHHAVGGVYGSAIVRANVNPVERAFTQKVEAPRQKLSVMWPEPARPTCVIGVGESHRSIMRKPPEETAIARHCASRK